MLLGGAVAAAVVAAAAGAALTLVLVVVEGVEGEVGRLKTARGDCGDAGRLLVARVGLFGELPSSVLLSLFSLARGEGGRRVDASGDMRR